ncbi:MAG: BatD family protein [Elusimicrobiaceae bacterium]|nr:BatD family protein [Elusimicrobiaceae bacterium]
MKKFLLLLCCLCVSVAVQAQVLLKASTDKTDLALDDDLTLTVQVSGVSGTMVMPQLPSLPAFNIYAREAEQSTVNGRTTLLFRYVMVPRFVGSTSIGPIKFNYQGKTYQTEPIAIRIYKTAVPPTAQKQTTPAATNTAAKATDTDVNQLPPLEQELATRAYAHPNQIYFLTAATSQKKPYVNEPFTLAVRFYYAGAFYDAFYKNPEVSNLLLEEAGETQGQQTLHGRVYQYTEKRYRVSGVAPGQATIGPATVTYRVGSVNGSLLDRFFGGAAVSKEESVSSLPFKLTITSLPQEGKPESFYGAVGGAYTLSAKLDRDHAEAGEAVTLSVTVQGTGNLKTTSDLVFPEIPGFTAYPAAPQTGNVAGSTTRNYKVFQTVLVPTVSGSYTIASIPWSYFDPQTARYKTLNTRPLSLEVSPSSHTANALDFGAAGHTGSGIQTMGHDIRYILTVPTEHTSWLARLPQWKWMHALVLGWLALCLFIASIGRRTAQRKHAYTQAKAQLKKAHSYEDISDALATYLLQKWNISTASLPLKSIVQALARHNVPAAQCEEFSTLWKDLESARFSPAQSDPNALAQFSQRAQNLLKNWENLK